VVVVVVVHSSGNIVSDFHSFINFGIKFQNSLAEIMYIQVSAYCSELLWLNVNGRRVDDL